MSTYHAFLGLGSNVGDRHAFLVAAVRGLRACSGVRPVSCSSVYETDPVGKTDQGKFLNVVLEIETTLAPPGLLECVKGLEETVGRTATEHWGPREIDVDILLYDGLVHQGETLTVPHAELEQRKFVLVPLTEIAPDVVHPVNGMTMQELLAACRDTSRVVRSTYHIVL